MARIKRAVPQGDRLAPREAGQKRVSRSSGSGILLRTLPFAEGDP
jgi:hypothetical protein